MTEFKKEYLKQYLYQETEINSLLRLLHTYPEKETEYKFKISQCYKIRADIEKKISAVDDILLREVLFHKYIFGKTLDEISYILNYSKRHIERLHIKALEKIEI